jgi:protein-disulfide isomerase
MKAKLELSVNILVGIAAVVVIAQGILAYRMGPAPVVDPSAARRPPTEPEIVDVRGATLALSEAVMKKSASSRFVIVEFSDYECPYCGRYARETFNRITQEYVETGKLSYAFMNFPLDSIHQRAFQAAEAAECAGEQGRYWQMHDLLFQNQKALTPERLPSHAGAAGLNVSDFQECLAAGRAQKVQRHVDEGTRVGVKSTPTFFLGELVGTDQVKLVARVKGARGFEVFKKAVDQLFASTKLF